jgi:hypothetical protein
MPNEGNLAESAVESIVEIAGALPPVNSEIRKIAEDVFNAAKYDVVSVAANAEYPARSDTLESAVKDALAQMDEAKRTAVVAKAQQLAQLPKEARTELFGRYGEMDPTSFLSQGFDRVHESLGPLDIDTKLLGVRQSTIAVPARWLRFTPEGLVVPKEQLAGFEMVGRGGRTGTAEEAEAAVNQSIEAAVRSSVLDTTRLAELYATDLSIGFVGEDIPSEIDQDVLAPPTRLDFYIRRVRCVDETNPEWWGSDEIALAGVAVDESGDTKKIAEQSVGGGFDDGDEKWYKPHWRYQSFNLAGDDPWPRYYGLSLFLAEKDHGGFSNALNKIWKAIRDQVKAAIAQAVTDALTPDVGPIIAKAIAMAVNWVVEKLVDWIISTFKDDIFPPAVADLQLKNAAARFLHADGSVGWASNLKRAHFSGHGGHYYVEYYWQLAK